MITSVYFNISIEVNGSIKEDIIHLNKNDNIHKNEVQDIR